MHQLLCYTNSWKGWRKGYVTNTRVAQVRTTISIFISISISISITTSIFVLFLFLLLFRAMQLDELYSYA